MADEQTAATTWMFQYNPTDYKLDEELKKKLIEPWTIYWGRSLVQLGERIYFMRSGGPRAAITAIGRIASQVREDLNQSSKYLRYWVDVVYDARVDPPLTRPDMLRDEVLSQYGPYAKGEFRANFALPPEVVARTERLIEGHLHPLEASGATSTKRIFVSHSHEDNAFGTKLVHDLRLALGGREEAVWYDTSGGLQVGDTWWEVIRKELEQRRIVVVILSPEAMTSKFVNRELDMAMISHKQILPILYKPCRVRLDLNTFQYVSFLPPNTYEAALQEVLMALGLAS